MKNFYKNLILVFASMIWGTNFVFQSIASRYISALMFNGMRFLIAFVFLAIVIAIRKIFKLEKKYNKKSTIIGGLLCGLLLFLGSLFQQIGIANNSPGKAGFISVLYIVIVPIIAIFYGKKPTLKVWIAVSISILGMYFLCVNDKAIMSTSDIFLLISAVSYSFHIIVIDKFADDCDAYILNCIQSLVTTILCMLFSFVFLKNIFSFELSNVLIPLLYAGIMSSGIAYLLQVVGQKDNDPSVASLFLSLESVFALVSSYLFLNDILTARELLGCGLILFAIILVQIKTTKSS